MPRSPSIVATLHRPGTSTYVASENRCANSPSSTWSSSGRWPRYRRTMFASNSSCSVGEVAMRAIDLAEYLASVDKQDAIRPLGLAFAAVQEPQRDRQRHRVEEVRADGDHHVDRADPRSACDGSRPRCGARRTRSWPSRSRHGRSRSAPSRTAGSTGSWRCSARGRSGKRRSSSSLALSTRSTLNGGLAITKSNRPTLCGRSS